VPIVDKQSSLNHDLVLAMPIGLSIALLAVFKGFRQKNASLHFFFFH